MGNIHGWGGPLTKEVRYNEFLLNKRITEPGDRAGHEAHPPRLQRLRPSRHDRRLIFAS